jgi:hypothetical protein
LVEDGAADGADQVDEGVGEDVRGQGDLVAGGLQGEGEAGAVGIDAGGAGGVSDRDADGLICGEQGVDLLGDPGRGAGAQDSATEHAFS